MSRPYININALTYASSVLTMNWTYFKTRGGGSYSITGFANPIAFSDTDANNTAETLTFSVASLGFPTDSASTFTDPSIIYTVSGTSSTSNTARVYINGVTISTTVAGTTSLGSWLGAIANGFDISATLASTYTIGGWTANVAMTTATAGTITFTSVNSGSYYNNTYNLVVTGLAASASSITSSVTSNTFSGGVTNYALTMNYPRLGGLDLFTFPTTSN